MSTANAGIPSEDLLLRIYAEYVEMPGMRLTARQAQRLWGIDLQTCLAALAFLTEIKFLRRTNGDLYARATDGPAAVPPVRMAKAALRTEETASSTVGRTA